MLDKQHSPKASHENQIVWNEPIQNRAGNSYHAVELMDRDLMVNDIKGWAEVKQNKDWSLTLSAYLQPSKCNLRLLVEQFHWIS